MCCEALLKQTGLPCNKIAYNFIGKATELEQVWERPDTYANDSSSI